jgi:hypothetical protein
MADKLPGDLSIEPALIEEQLKRLSQSSHFRHSRRYPAFLEHVVSKTLAGKQEELKERLIGIEAFGRDPDYDLNADPVVRVTAGEVRKRLAQYYYEAAHQNELRIELHPGAYLPVFRMPFQNMDSADADSHLTAPTETSPRPDKTAPADVETVLLSPARGNRNLLPIVLILLGVIAAGGAVFGYSLWKRHTTAISFWQPFLDSRQPITLAVGSVTLLNPPLSPTGPSPESVGIHPLFADPVAFSDTVAVSNVRSRLAQFGISSTVQSSTSISFSELQKGPIILISGFNNPWTMRLTAPLRFHFRLLSVDTYEIVDAADPEHRHWAINTRTDYRKIDHDYALIARFHDKTTDQPVLVVAGIGDNGTIAASQQISDDRFLKELEHQGKLPRPDQNWEAVLETQVIDSRPGPPRILDVCFF